jgi:hypothetical protein
MASLTANQVRDLIRATQDRYRAIDHDDWAAARPATARIAP